MALAHDFPFDPTYGYDLPALRALKPPSPVEGFRLFWQETYDQTLATDPDVATRSLGDGVHEIEYTGLGGFRVGGWLVISPGEVTRGVVFGHGYGGRSAPEPVPGPPAVTIFPCARGFDRSASRNYPGDATRHVIAGLFDRQTYSHRFCTADLFAATTVLLTLYPHLAGRVDYIGQSFGGGIGALALPAERRWRRAVLDIPSFGNHPIRLTLPGVGSGESVRQYAAKHPKILDVLPFFDAAAAASLANTPTLVAAALFDPAVPPPGQFSIYNALPGEKQLFVRTAAHFDWPGHAAEDAALFNEAAAWFADPL